MYSGNKVLEILNCGIFQKQEPVIEEITNKINRTSEPNQKIEYAKDLLEEINLLLMCPEYHERDSDCKTCHNINNLRKMVAELIMITKKLI
ncbi:MAG: hypothetical protein AB1498_03365 [bacterium]